MTIDTYLISSWSNVIVGSITEKVIQALQENTQDTLSADDSSLENLWEELCYQVQYDESFYFSIYIEHLEVLIEEHIDALTTPEKIALWLNSKNGFSWWDANDKIEYAHKKIPLDEKEIMELIKEAILCEASNFTNENIENY